MATSRLIALIVSHVSFFGVSSPNQDTQEKNTCALLLALFLFLMLAKLLASVRAPLVGLFLVV